jgi:RHS repeat-associated protein
LESKFAYDTLNRVTGLSNAAASYTYTLDGTVGNRTGVTEQLATQTHPRIVGWGYDNIYRLTNENISADPNSKIGSVTYGLDPVGNRLSLGLSQGSNLPGISPIQSGSITYDPDDRLSTESYDVNGNTLTTGGKTFAYDFENRLKSMTEASVAVTIQYDADGNRVSKTANGVTTQYLVDDLNPTGYAQVVEEVTAGAVTRQYTYGLQRISQNQQIANAWTPSFYGYDGAGTVRLLTDSTGTVTDTYDYDAWGNTANTTGSTPNVYRYRNEQFDSDLDLYYLRARYFNPVSGRLLTRDPWAGVVTNPVTLHRYLYASGDPVGHGDPSGRDTMPMPWPQPQPRKIGVSEYVMLALAFALNPAVDRAVYNVGQTIKCWWVDIADELRGAANAALLAVGGGGGAPDGGPGLLPYRPSKCRFTGEGMNPGTGGEGPKGKICIEVNPWAETRS